MASFDLKPLTEETIKELKLKHDELWMVMIYDDLHGPFEQLSLLHYSLENQALFEDAYAAKVNQEEWIPFHEHACFARKVVRTAHEGKSFWLLENGKKSLSFSQAEIDKKIEMGLLIMTDVISLDDGYSWKKIYQVSEFKGHFHSASELPKAPLESSFQKAVAKLPPPKKPDEGITAVAYRGQKFSGGVSLKLEELTLNKLYETEVSKSLKWAIPSAFAGVLTLASAGYYFFNPSIDMVADVDQSSQIEFAPQTTASQTSAADQRVRRPSSFGAKPFNQRSTLTQPRYEESRYPTHVETHDYNNQDLPDPSMEAEPAQATEEPSLVSAPAQPEGDQSLDAAMNGVEQPAPAPQPDPGLDAPMVESSDF